jgi:hypothetical protein
MLASPALLAVLAVAAFSYGMLRPRKACLPPPGPKKRDPAQLEKMHDRALEDSMAASDPPSTVMPEVH